MSYEIRLSSSASKQLRKFDPPTRRLIQAAIELLAENPRPPKAKPLVNADGAWRVRVGDYRVVYEINDAVLLVLVLRMGHRREVYLGKA